MARSDDSIPADDRFGVLLVNIGSPAAPRAGPVRRYLREFLGDPRIVELPRWLWQPVLQGVILAVRPWRSARAYRRVWRQEGAPLVHHSRRISSALQDLLDARTGGRARVGLAMRYGEPSIARTLAGFRNAGIERVLVLPLHPQYCATTVASAFDGVAGALRGARRVPELRFISGYHDHPGYIAALAASIRAHWADGGAREHLLLSYHSIPVAYADRGDPYPQQAHRTSALVARELGLGPGEWSVCFQSRFGAGRWLGPSTDDALLGLAAAGIRRASVIAPVFPTDCLESLQDLAIHAVAHFHKAGGDRLDVVPALNDQREHLAFLADLVMDRSAGWVKPATAAADSVIRLVRNPG